MWVVLLTAALAYLVYKYKHYICAIYLLRQKVPQDIIDKYADL